MKNLAFLAILGLNILTINIHAQSSYAHTGEPFDVGFKSTLTDLKIAENNYLNWLNKTREKFIISNYHLTNEQYYSVRNNEIDKWRYLAAGILYQLDEKQRVEFIDWCKKQTEFNKLNVINELKLIDKQVFEYAQNFISSTDGLDIKLKKFKSKGDKTGGEITLNEEVTWGIDAKVDDEYIKVLQIKKEDNLNKNSFDNIYTASFELNKEVNSFHLNSKGLIPERNTLNNSNQIPTSFTFNALKLPDFNADTLQITWRPDIWYNQFDGVKLGARIKSNYQKEWYKLDAGVYYSLGTPQADFDQYENEYQTVSWFATFESRTEKLIPNSSIQFHAQQLDGLEAYKAKYQVKTNSLKTHLGSNIGYLNRKKEAYLNYLFDNRLWNTNQWNGYLEVFLNHSYQYKTGSGEVHFTLRTSAPESDYNYSYVRLESKNTQKISILPVHIRIFAQYGSGSNWAPESQLYLAGANPEEQMSNPLTRSAGIIPSSLGTYGAEMNNFHESGGLNLRGYAGYLAPFEDNEGTQYLTYRGTSGVSATGEIPWTSLIPLQVKSVEKYLNVSSYLFGDIGMINSNNPEDELEWADARADAGIGAKIDVFQWWNYTDLKPISIRFDVPFWLNSPPPTQEYFEFRWLIGLSKTF